MRHSFLLLLFSLSIAMSTPAQATEPTPVVDEPQYEVKVDQQAAFPSGATGMMHYIGRHIRHPIEALKQSLQGNVFVKFTVGTAGQILKTEVIKTDYELLGPAAIHAVTGMPGWKPTYLHDQPIKVSYVFPFDFKWKGMRKAGSLL